jgi:hypothetical protein
MTRIIKNLLMKVNIKTVQLQKMIRMQQVVTAPVVPMKAIAVGSSLVPVPR